MLIGARGLVILVGLFFCLMGGRFVLMPKQAAVQFFLHVDGAAGWSTIRGDLGGAFLTVGIITLLALRRDQYRWLLVPGMFLTVVMAARIVGIAGDGIAPPVLLSLGVEAVLLAMVLAAWSVLRRSAAVGQVP